MWTDNETCLDLLGFRVHADLIRSVVTNPNLLPVTIGVFADWGGGKTSLMKMLEASLEPEHWKRAAPERERCEKIACLYFNGWLFEGYDDAKSAILTSVLVALGEHKRFGPKVREKCASLLKSVNWMRVASLGLKHVAVPAIAAFATGGTSLVPAFVDSLGSLLPWKKKHSDDDEGDSSCSDDGGQERENVNWEELLEKDSSPSGPLDVRCFREQFARLLQASDIDSLVVLIDDLDRCSPERIIENLEAIKLFLNVEHTAFVIGADPRIVRHAIAWKYKQHELRDESRLDVSGDRLIDDYLEKLIQYPYRLPRLSPAEIETYMTLLFCQSHLTKEQFERMAVACDQQRMENRYAVFGYGAVEAAFKKCGETVNADTMNALNRSLSFCAAAAPLITEGLKGNPRQVKRFLNAFVLRQELAKVAKLTNVDDSILVKLMILEYAEEKQFRQLFQWQATQEGHPKEIVALEQAARGLNEPAKTEGEVKDLPAEWSSTFSRKWLSMAPSFSGVDLRDYFWVARDRLQTSLSGLSMISPVVRRAFESLLSNSPTKRDSALAALRGFQEDEQTSLFGLLDQHIRHKPSDKSGYDAYRLLVEKDIVGAAQRLAQALLTSPPDLIPAAVGMDILTLSRARSELASTLAPAIKRLEESDSRAGAAIKTGKAAQKKM
jgi:predicted KAP-like P-loop ATPase